MKNNFSKTFHKGLTIPELLISFTLFVIITGVTTGMFLVAVRTQRATSAFLNAQTNARFVLESISREIRTAMSLQIYLATGGSSRSGTGRGENGDTLAFINQSGESVRYRVINGRIEKSANAGNTYYPITADGVAIESFRFYLSGADPGDGNQARLTLSIRARAQVGSEENIVWVQTTITQRELDS